MKVVVGGGRCQWKTTTLNRKLKQVVWQLQCYIHLLHVFKKKKKKKPNSGSICEFLSAFSLNRQKLLRYWGGLGQGFWRKANGFFTYRTHYTQTQVVHISMVTRDRAIGASPMQQQEKASQGWIHHRRSSSFQASAEPGLGNSVQLIFLEPPPPPLLQGNVWSDILLYH